MIVLELVYLLMESDARTEVLLLDLESGHTYDVEEVKPGILPNTVEIV